MNYNDAMMLVAIICLNSPLQPEDLQNIGYQLAAFDAVNDAKTEEEACYV